TIYHIPYTIHHTPYTIYHTPYTIYHTPYTIHHIPYTIHHILYTIHHILYTLYHTPYTIHHSLCTIHHAPYTVQVSMAAISIIDVDEAWSLYFAGFEGGRAHRRDAICAHTILQDGVYVVPDCGEWYSHSPNMRGREDGVSVKGDGACDEDGDGVSVCDGECNGYVPCDVLQENSVHFYAGAPITIHGRNIGALCILHTQPIHNFSKEDEHTLLTISLMVRDILTHQHDIYMQLMHDVIHMRKYVCASLSAPIHALTQLAGRMYGELAGSGVCDGVSDVCGRECDVATITPVGGQSHDVCNGYGHDEAHTHTHGVCDDVCGTSACKPPLLVKWEREMERVGRLVEDTITELAKRPMVI
ncbi:GAF domain-containing protein, partial [archaeon]